MLSLPNRLTILSYVENWLSKKCDSCGKDIDVLWHADPQDTIVQWAPDSHETFLLHCPECLVWRLAPPDKRDALRKRYRRLRIDRCFAGLGAGPYGTGAEMPARESVRDALRWSGDQPITLHVKTQRGQTKRSADAYLQRFVIFGAIADSMRGYIDMNTIRKYPQFHLEQFEYHRPGLLTDVAVVDIGASARDPRYPHLELQEHLNWHNPGRPEPFRIPGRQFHSAPDIGSFVTRAMTLYEERGKAGAPPGVRNPHKYPRRLIEIEEHLGRRPTAAEFRRNFHQFEGEGQDVPSELAEKTLQKFLAGESFADWADAVLDADDSNSEIFS